MTTTIYHGGNKPTTGRVWATESADYARGYVRGGKLYRRSINLDRRNVLDLRAAGLDAVRAARIITRETGIEVAAHDEMDTHQVVGLLTDAQLRAAGVDVVAIVEETWGERAETLCLVGAA